MSRHYRDSIFLTLLLAVTVLAGCGSVPAPAATAAAAPASTSTPVPADIAVTAADTPTAESKGDAGNADAGNADAGNADAGNADAGNADVLFVQASQAADGTWTFAVTVEHPDSGWEDYADGWDVVTPDGQVLKPNPDDAFTRVLLHPHENEQPFTRSQGGIAISEGVTEVRVRAHDLVDGYGGQEVVVDLTADSGPNFEVQRQ